VGDRRLVCRGGVSKRPAAVPWRWAAGCPGVGRRGRPGAAAGVPPGRPGLIYRDAGDPSR